MEEVRQNPAPRTPLSLEISFKRNYAREESKGVLKNVSLTGTFLELNGHNFRTNEKIHLFLTVAGRERKLAASVVWANALGCGLKFIPSNNRDIQIVDDLIYYIENGRQESRFVMDSIFKKVS